MPTMTIQQAENIVTQLTRVADALEEQNKLTKEVIAATREVAQAATHE